MYRTLYHNNNWGESLETYVRMLEFLNGVPALITGVASFLAALAALLGLFERRRSKRDEAFQQKIEDTVDKTLINMNKTNEEQQKAIEALRESTDDLNCKLDDMGKSVKNLSAKVEDNELSRLKTTIVDFANQLRMGLKPNSTGFEHVLNIYDRYDHLGGNGYIKTEIEFIREAKKEIEQEEKNKNKK